MYKQKKCIELKYTTSQEAPASTEFLFPTSKLKAYHNLLIKSTAQTESCELYPEMSQPTSS